MLSQSFSHRLFFLYTCFCVLSSFTSKDERSEVNLNPVIRGKVYADFNENGIFDGQDYPYFHVAVAAYPDCNTQNTPIIVRTDAQGDYIFDNLPIPPSQYTIQLFGESISICGNDIYECVVIDPDPGTIAPIDFICVAYPCPTHSDSHHYGCHWDERICDLSQWSETPCASTSGDVFNPIPSCFGTYYNVSYFNFYGMEGDYNINIDTYNCFGPNGTGIQYGLFEGCSESRIDIVCEEGPVLGLVTISSELIDPCKEYTLWISGHNQSVCSYFLYIDGNSMPCEGTEIEDILIETDCETMCPQTYTIEIVPKGNIAERIEQSVFQWTIFGPNNSWQIETQGLPGLTTDFNFATEGEYEICVESTSLCEYYHEPLCKSFIFENLTKEVLEYSVCRDEFPFTEATDSEGHLLVDANGQVFQWSGGPVTFDMFLIENRYSSTYTADCGCTYQQEILLDLIKPGQPCLEQDSISGYYNEECSCIIPDENFKIYTGFCQPADTLSYDGTIKWIVSGGIAPFSYKIYKDNNILASGTHITNTWVQLDSIGTGYHVISVRDSLGKYVIQPFEIGISETLLQWGETEITDLRTNPPTYSVTVKNISGGLPPYSYSLTDANPVPHPIDYQESPTFSPINSGTYIIVVKDSTGCELTKEVHTPSPSNSIWGYVFLDINSNGIFDSGETFFENIQVGAFPNCDVNQSPVAIITTDTDGKFEFNSLSDSFDCYSFKVIDTSGFQCISNMQKNIFIDHTVPFSDSVFISCQIPFCPVHPKSYGEINDALLNTPLCDLSLLEQSECVTIHNNNHSWTGQNHCGGQFSNTSFFNFIAGHGQYTIEIDIQECAGYGLEYGVEKITSSGLTQIICMGHNHSGLITISSDIFDHCENYILWINGHKGSVCSYQITIKNDYTPCSTPEIEQIILDADCLHENSDKPWMAGVKFNPTGPEVDLKNATFEWLLQKSSTTLMISEVGLDSLDLKNHIEDAGTYRLCLTTKTLCYSSRQKCIDFTIEPQEVLSKNFELCRTSLVWNGSFDEDGNLFTDSHGNPWLWDGGEISVQQVLDSSGIFESNYIDYNGCMYKQRLIIDLLTPGDPCNDGDIFTQNDILDENCQCFGTTSTHDFFAEYDIQILPNPTRDILNITGKSLSNMNISIKNTIGLQVLKNLKICSESLCELDVSTIPPGIYWLEINDGKNVRYYKIIRL